MILSVNLLHKVQKRLKQPYNSINLELSYSLCNKQYYYIDSYLKYYLTQIGEYKIYKKISSEVINKASEFKLFKYLYNFGIVYHYHDYLCKICSIGNINIIKHILSKDDRLNKTPSRFNDHITLFTLSHASNKGHFRILKLLVNEVFTRMIHLEYSIYDMLNWRRTGIKVEEYFICPALTDKRFGQLKISVEEFLYRISDNKISKHVHKLLYN